MTRRLVSSFGMALSIVGIFVIWHNIHATALSGSNWQAGNIISDSIFTNSTSMTVQQIEDFITNQINANGGCDTWGTQTATDWGSSLTHAQYAQSRGWPAPPYVCLNEYYEVPKTSPGPAVPDNSYNHYDGNSKTLLSVPGGISAAEIIYDAAQQYQINPEALLVKLQTESAGPLTQDTWPLSYQYTYAMGSHCPDSGPNGSAQCDTNYSGFSMQIYSAASLLRYYLDNMRQSWWPYKTPYATNSVLYSLSTSSCGASDVYIDSKATAALYTYTPYQPNGAALANVSSTSSGGLGDSCSQYGNRNFWWWFSHWFGSPNYAPPSCDSRIGNVSCVWQLDGPSDANFLTSSGTERDTAVYSSKYSYDAVPFHTYTTQQPGTVPVYRLRLSNEHFYTADQSEMNTLLQNSQNTYEGVAFYMYPGSTNTNASYPIYRLDGGYGHLFVASAAERDRLVSAGYTYEGVAFNAPSAFATAPDPTANDLNVYRITAGGEHVYTEDIAERDSLISKGWTYEGVMLDAPLTPNSSPVYRLIRGADHVYTPSSTEKDQLVAAGWAYEGIAWYIDNTTPQTYRFYINGEHFYTADPNEALLIANNGAHYESIAFGYSQSTTPPSYRLFNGTYHFFTSDINEALLSANNGWKYEGIAWYASQATTSIPIYRLANGSQHFYTASSAEMTTLVNNGWKYEGIAWYASPTTTSTSVYRLMNGAQHFYTTSDTEKTALVNNGWKYEGIAWYGF